MWESSGFNRFSKKKKKHQIVHCLVGGVSKRHWTEGSENVSAMTSDHPTKTVRTENNSLLLVFREQRRRWSNGMTAVFQSRFAMGTTSQMSKI
jgi:hypothetical protein